MSDLIQGIIEVYSGAKVDVENFQSSDYDMDDVAHSLGNQCRFNGHCKEFYSVAQHAVLCSHFARSGIVAETFGLTERGSLEFAMYCLHHDDTEAYVGDCVRPLKTVEFKIRENKIMLEIWKSLDIPFPTEMDHNVIKFVDDTLCITEAKQLMKSKAEWWTGNFPEPWEFEIVPEDPKDAKEIYLQRHMDLLVKLSGLTHA